MISKKKVKAQVAVFVILVVLVIVVIAVYFLFSPVSDTKKNVNPEVRPIYDFVEQCFQDAAYQAVDYTSKKGGYYLTPKLATDEEIAYFIFDGANYIPSKEQVAGEIGLFIDDSIYVCTKEFSDFPEFEVSFPNRSESIVEIQDKEVVIKTKYTLSIKKGDNTYNLEDFETKVNARLGTIYDVAYELTMDQTENYGRGLCIACIFELSEANDLYINALDIDQKTMLFVIRDENSKINKGDFTFNFAIR